MEKLNSLFSPVRIGGVRVGSRLVMPPMVCFGWAGEDGIVTDKHVAHYHARARGMGIVVVEAACVAADGRLTPSQLGVWEDGQISGLARIAQSCRAAGARVFLQIHHAGERALPGLLEGSVEKLKQIEDCFAAAAHRASIAGFDGVELHGAHGYLLSQLASPQKNTRADEYGGSVEGRTLLACNVIRRIKLVEESGFAVGVRMGGNEPDYAGGIEVAKAYEEAGADFLHVSSGIGGGTPDPVPEGFPYNSIVYGASLIKQAVSVPVIAVNEIRTPERADWLIANGHADLVAIGRPVLNNPAYAADAIANGGGFKCKSCKPCKWFERADSCPQ